MSLLVKIGRKGKKLLKRVLPAAPCSLSYTRRIERIRTTRRICAMTFDDGPADVPAVPDGFGGRSLTDVLLDELAQYGARATFDVVGDTSENYPDKAGKTGGAAWGGVRYDHYPDFGKDEKGGAAHNERLIRRMLDEGHQITNHGYRHILFGKKNFVYNARAHFTKAEEAEADLRRLHRLMEEKYGYPMTMARPPHYVDRISGGLTAYDVYDALGYQYMAASFDGAGWLPSTLADGSAALEAEAEAMVEPMRRALEEDPDAFCGQIIFQKDGCNMAKRTPVAYGLPKQLALLRAYGYTVVPVDELLRESPFADVGREDPLFEKLCALAQTRAVVYSDNRLRLDAPMKNGELALLLTPKREALSRRRALIAAAGKRLPTCAGAMEYCVQNGLLPAGTDPEAAVTALPEGYFEKTEDLTRRGVYAAYRMQGDEKE